MKKRFMSLLSIFLCICMLIPATFAQDSRITTFYSTEKISAIAGMDLSLPISIRNNTGLAGFKLYVLCDPSVFTMDENDDGSIDVAVGNIMKGKGSVLCKSYSGAKGTGWQILWYDLQNMSNDGILFDLPIKVSQDAAPGEYPLKLIFSQLDTINELGEAVPCVTSNSTIIVSDNTPTVFGDQAEAVAGKTVNYSVSVRCNPGVAIYKVYLEYDKSVFSPLLNESGNSLQIQQGDVRGANIICTQTQKGCQVGWISVNGIDVSDDGVLFTIPLTVSSKADPGVYEIKVICSNDDTTNSDCTEVGFKTVNGYITVSKPAHTHCYTETVTAPTCTEQGYITYTCECGDSYVDNYVPALGHNYTNGVCTRCGEADPGYKPPINVGKLVVSDARAKAGEEVTVSVSIEDNPGIMVMALGIDYDRSKLELIGYGDGIMTGWKVKTNAVWIGADDVTASGVILTLKFKVLEDVADGYLQISLLFSEGDIANHNEEIIMPEISSGTITVYSHVPGDVTGDGKVNALDLVRLQRYLSGENVVIGGSCDITGDGKVNALDLVRLQRYLSGEAVAVY